MGSRKPGLEGHKDGFSKTREGKKTSDQLARRKHYLEMASMFGLIPEREKGLKLRIGACIHRGG